MDRGLPPKLSTILNEEPNSEFAGRLRIVFDSAAKAIDKLGELDLIKYEDSPIDGSADLSLWEEVAPVVGSTIADVNALLADMAARFPPGVLSVDARQSDVEAILGNAATELRDNVAKLGMRIRDPAIVGDRWNLIAELQSFRFKFRDRIGAMVFETVSILSDCKRREVDPGYDELLAATLVVRSTTADLRRLMHNRITKVSEAEPEDVEWNANQIEKELNAFGRTAAWRATRAQDKKVVLEFRALLREVNSPTLSKDELLRVLEPFVEFVDTFAAVNNRELLIQHDQEMLASIGVVLESAQYAADPTGRLAAFSEAVAMAQSLYGKNNDFDSFLRRLRKTQVTVESVSEELEQFVIFLPQLMQ